MGIDWRTADLSTFLETLEAFNRANDPDAPKGDGEASERLQRFMDAHRG